MRKHTTPSYARDAVSGDYRDVQIASASHADTMSKRELDRRLDDALEDTFPASDPVSIVAPVGK